MRVLLVSANRERQPSPVVPLGLLWVAATARQEHDVRLVDLCFADEPLAALEAAIDDFQPEVVGLGLRNLHGNAYDGSEPLLAWYETLAATIRGRTTAPLVLGGAGFSLQPRRIVERLGADHGIIGEGERLFVELLGRLQRGERPPRLLTAAALDCPSDGDGALDGLPAPARELADPAYFTDGQGDGTVNLQSKRGCSFGCSYCDYPDLEGRLIRLRDPEQVADEALACARPPGGRPPPRHLFFVDSVFNNPRGHALAISRALARRGAALPWLCYATPAALDEELCAAMAAARCVGVEVGTDTGTDETLRRLNKPFRRADVLAAHRHLAAAGIRDCHTFVVGAGDETIEEARATLAFVDELDPDVAVFIVFWEDRESRGPGAAHRRQALLDLLAEEAPKRPGWVVPELQLRFGPRLDRLLAQRQVRGPSWLHLARLRRRLAA